MQIARFCRAGPLLAYVAASWAFSITGLHAGDWTITPRVSGQEIFTDNVLDTPTNRRSDFITSISPGIDINGESTRLQAKLDYSPIFQVYALTPSQDFIGHNLYGNATATLVPDLLFFDARGYAALLPTNPTLSTGLTSGLAPSGPSPITPNLSNLSTSLTGLSPTLPSSQLSQVSSFAASPYLQKRFDGIGLGEIRYTMTDTNFGNAQSGRSATLPGFGLQNTSTLTNEGTATFLTGEEFGPYAGRALLDAAQSTGAGVTSGSQFIATLDSAYAVTRRIAALWTIGHETIHFGGVPPTAINDIVWGLGIQLTPSPDLTLTVSYGHRNGFTAPNASLVYHITARTVLSASYTEGLQTVAQEIANNLALSDLNALGQTIDTRTLLPFSIVNPVLGLQSGLFHMKQLTATIGTDLERNHFAASVNRTENLLVSQNTAGTGTSEQATSFNLTWSRELNPLTTANLGVGYSISSFPGFVSTTTTVPTTAEENLFAANALVTYAFNASLTGWASYNFLDRTSPQPQLRLLANIVSVGLSKRF